LVASDLLTPTLLNTGDIRHYRTLWREENRDGDVGPFERRESCVATTRPVSNFSRHNLVAVQTPWLISDDESTEIPDGWRGLRALSLLRTG